MGNREDLLESARRCIVEKGYARTTARDIAGGAGVSLAAIGYHFGSKEALMAEALLDTGIRIGDALDEALRGASAGDLLGRIWDRSLAVFVDQRALLAASMENLAQIDRIPAVGERMRAAQRGAVEGIAELLADPLPHATDAERRALAAYYFAVINGLAIVWLIDPSIVPAGDLLRRAELAAGGSGTDRAAASARVDRDATRSSSP